MTTDACLCGHPDLDHPGGECIRPLCGCGEFRPDPLSAAGDEPVTGKSADCRMPCDPDCEVGPVHCWNYHRPNHKPDWHDPERCDAAGKSATTEEGAA